VAGFNPYAAAGVPTPQVNLGQPSPYASLYRKGATGGTFKGDPLTNFLSGLVGRPAAASGLAGDPTHSRYGTPSTETSDYNAWRPSAPVLPPPTSPNTTFQNADEEYKTLLSQYGGAPGISQLAGMASLPTGFTPTGATKQANLKDYYAAQTLQGNANLGTIIKDMGYSGKMAEWAQLHPGLAQEQYAKKFGAGSAGGRDIGSFIGDVTRYADQGQASPAGQTSFGEIANPVAPTTAWNQGAMVDANRGKENLVPQQAAKTNGGGMTEMETTAKPQTTLDKVSGFLNRITPVIKAVFPAGAGQIFGPNY
jgi:hypothetical protein